MSERPYLSRLCDVELQLALQAAGAVLIEGAKWYGKTRIASEASQSILYMDEPDIAASIPNELDFMHEIIIPGVHEIAALVVNKLSPCD